MKKLSSKGYEVCPQVSRDSINLTCWQQRGNQSLRSGNITGRARNFRLVVVLPPFLPLPAGTISAGPRSRFVRLPRFVPQWPRQFTTHNLNLFPFPAVCCILTCAPADARMPRPYAAWQGAPQLRRTQKLMHKLWAEPPDKCDKLSESQSQLQSAAVAPAASLCTSQFVLSLSPPLSLSLSLSILLLIYNACKHWQTHTHTHTELSA